MMKTLLIVLGTVLVLANVAASSRSSNEKRLAHMVFFTLRDKSEQNLQALVAACHKYLADHEGTVYFSVGTRATEFNREVNDQQYDVALHLVFESKEAHDRYQTHPRHLEFIEKNQQLWSTVRVFDSYLTAAAE